MHSISRLHRLLLLVTGLSLMSFSATAQEVAEAELPLEESGWKFDAGGDIRIREEFFNHIPVGKDPPGVSRGGKNNSIRFRTMAWARAEYEGIIFYGRLNNEFRQWIKPHDSKAFDWPDELVIDNLYLRLDEVLGEGIVLTIGRQDIALGSRRLVLEGTPKDGSRTIYMNGVTLGVKIDDLTRLDLFGVYNTDEDKLAIGHEHRDLVGYKNAIDNMDDAGGGIFVTSRITEGLPFELYYLYKHDTSYTWLPKADEDPVRVGASDYHTFGLRLMPQFSSRFSGELELAGQFGKEDSNNTVRAMMAAGGIAWKPEERRIPALSANFIYLSGDDESTGRQEGFNPLWGRYPWVSELYVYSWDLERAGFWTNLIYPYLQLTYQPAVDYNFRASIGPMFAEEKNGPGHGNRRGWLGIARLDFPIAKGLLGTKDTMKGHLLAEVLKPGSYYEVSHTSYFLRWEVSYAF